MYIHHIKFCKKYIKVVQFWTVLYSSAKIRFRVIYK